MCRFLITLAASCRAGEGVRQGGWWSCCQAEARGQEAREVGGGGGPGMAFRGSEDAQ